MNSLLPLLLLMSGFNKKDSECENDESGRDTNGLGNLLPLLFLTGGFGGSKG